MPKRRELNIETRARICFLREMNVSNREIARQLNISECCVRRTIKRKEETGGLESRKRSGRPRSMTERDEQYIRVISLRNRRLTAPQITAEFNLQRRQPVSVSTVKRRLIKAGLKGRIAVRKPRLSTIHKRKRLNWAKAHANWSLDQWKNVLWTDESKFELFGSKRRTFIRRRPGKEC